MEGSLVGSNTLVIDVNGFKMVTAYTNMLALNPFGPVYIWELNGGATNSLQAKIESVWVGYTDPALEMLGDPARGTTMGTNGIPFEYITYPAIITNTYISTVADRNVGITNASSSAGGRTNKLPAIGTF